MRKLVVFSGAGMSAESGIQTFRDSDGLWEQHRIEDVASPHAWRQQPEMVQRFYNQRRKHILAAQPNLAHQLIQQLENHFQVQVITQNIDDLHERAGSQHVLHLHGNIRLAKSSAPHAPQPEQYYPIDGWELDLHTHRCPQNYPLRPHVVWFGEAVPAYEDAIKIVKDCELFIVIGSSLMVYPVAGLIHEIPSSCQAYYIDPQADQLNLPAQYQSIIATASVGLSHLVEQLIQQESVSLSP